MNTRPIQSPSYPSLSLEDAVSKVEKIENSYRTTQVDRTDAAGLLGYSGLSGPANKALADLASYGLVQKAGSGLLSVTELATSILYPSSDEERIESLRKAAEMPPLFRDIRERFNDIPLPPEQGVMTYLNRAGFNPNAVPKAAKAFLETASYVQGLGSKVSDDEESDDAAMETEPRVQSETPARASKAQVRREVEQTSSASTVSVGFVDTKQEEWFRIKVGKDKLITINFYGEGEVGAKEIERLITILEAQKQILEFD